MAYLSKVDDEHVMCYVRSKYYYLCTKQVLLFVQTVVWIVLLIMACPSNAEDYRGFLYKPAQYKRFL